MIASSQIAGWHNAARNIEQAVEQIALGFADMTPANAADQLPEALAALDEAAVNLATLRALVAARGPQ